MCPVLLASKGDELGPVQILGKAKGVAHMAIVADVVEKLRVAEIIDEHVPPHPDREVSVGTCVEALVLAILAGGHALYRVAEILAPWDLELLLGQSDFDVAMLNDNRLGRALDSVFAAGTSSITTGVVLEAMKIYQLETDLLHFDTTSFKVHGAYADSVAGDPEVPDGAPHVTRGYSRDHRPDLKQVMFGLTVTNDGYVPVLGRVTDGNRNDTLENRFNLTRIAAVLPDPQAITLVADCKLFSGENLQLAKDHGLNLVTLMPKNMKVWERAFSAAAADLDEAPVLRKLVEVVKIEDEESGELSTTETCKEDWRGRSVSVTHCWERQLADGGKRPEEIELRALVVKSSQLEAKQRKTLARKFEQEKRALARLDKSFTKKASDFACAADARRAAEAAIAKLQRFHDSELKIVAVEREEKRARPGRPKKGEEPTLRTVYEARWKHRERRDRLAEEIRRGSCFVLVTLPSSQASDSDLLELYKGQIGIEQNFHWAKVAAEVAPIFLNSPERIAALGMVYVFALMVYTLIQRQIRAVLAAQGTTIPGNRGRSSKPTAEVLFRLLEGITSQPIRTAAGDEFYLLAEVTTEQARALDLLGCDLLKRDNVLARVIEPRRGQRGYKPPPPTEDEEANRSGKRQVPRRPKRKRSSYRERRTVRENN